MKKHLSVFAMSARCTVYRVIGLLAAMAAAESAILHFVFQKAVESAIRPEAGSAANLGVSVAIKLDEAFSHSRIVFVFAAAFLLMIALLCLPGCEFVSKQGYTLRRLRISEKAVFIWQAVYNVICFLLLWAAQLAVVLIFCGIYVDKLAQGALNGQAVYLLFYRNAFLHSLLPLDELTRWIRNICTVLALGSMCAYIPFCQRHTKHCYTEVVLMIGVVLLLYVCDTGGYIRDGALIMVSLLFMYISAGKVFGKELEQDA